jgi:RimJ/RimL family protein N-acetyltransferase
MAEDAGSSIHSSDGIEAPTTYPESELRPEIDLVSFQSALADTRLRASAIKAVTAGLNNEKLRAKGINSSTPKTAAEIESFLESAANDPNQRAYFVTSTYDRRVVYGMIRAVEIHEDQDGIRSAEVIATNTNYDSWKKSVMTNALQNFTVEMNDLGITRLWAKVDPENTAPQRVLQKASWKKVGERRIGGKDFLIYEQYKYPVPRK